MSLAPEVVTPSWLHRHWKRLVFGAWLGLLLAFMGYQIRLMSPTRPRTMKVPPPPPALHREVRLRGVARPSAGTSPGTGDYQQRGSMPLRTPSPLP